MSLENKTILLGISGSIAVYKSCDLLRRLKESGSDVYCMMSSGAQKFVTPLTFSALSGHPVHTDIWDPSLWKMAHIELAEKADLVLIAPSSAHCISQLAHGAANTLIPATVLATSAPILLAPAMHEKMWLHPSTQFNVKTLKSYGTHFVGPLKGPLLGSIGWGRMASTAEIINTAENIL